MLFLFSWVPSAFLSLEPVFVRLVLLSLPRNKDGKSELDLIQISMISW